MSHTTEIKLQDGQSVTSSEDPQALAERFQTARRVGTLIEVALGDDETVRINPDAVVTIGKAARGASSFG